MYRRKRSGDAAGEKSIGPGGCDPPAINECGCIHIVEAISPGGGPMRDVWCALACRAGNEDVNSGPDRHGRIPQTAIIPRCVRIAVMGGSVLVSTGWLQYCPAPRIPPDCSTGHLGRWPGLARAEGPVVWGSARGPAIIAWYVFMSFFLFTIVNTQYGTGRVIYPDLTPFFAASFLASCGYGISRCQTGDMTSFAGNKGIKYRAGKINNCEVPGTSRSFGTVSRIYGGTYDKNL